jgi:hypothetical protein
VTAYSGAVTSATARWCLGERIFIADLARRPADGSPLVGQVVWFAPDHFASGVTVLPGCPEYSLYTFDGVPDLASWIETGVTQWAG